MDINLLIGILGMFLILIGFLMNQLGKWSNDSLSYDLINLIGSGLMVYYSWTIQSYPFLVLNLVWVIFSLKDVIKDLK